MNGKYFILIIQFSLMLRVGWRHPWQTYWSIFAKGFVYYS